MAIANKVAVVVAVLVLLLQASSCAVARFHDDAYGRGSAPNWPAVMTTNGFRSREEGGSPSECDGQYHSDEDYVVALSTGWYDQGHRCRKNIRITSTDNGRSVEATVIDVCDSFRGCKDHILETSKAVWEALGLDTNIGEVPVTWSDV